MENDINQIRKSVEDIYRLMETLVALQRENHQCCRALAVPVEQAVPEQHYTRKGAAAFLLVHPRSVTRYRKSGRLPAVQSEANGMQIRYRENDLKACYFWKWGKHP